MDTDATYVAAKPIKANGQSYDVGDIIPHATIATIPWLHSYISTNHIIVVRGDGSPKWVPPHMYGYVETVQLAYDIIAGDPGIDFERALAAAEAHRRSVAARLALARAELQKAFAATQKAKVTQAEKDALAAAEKAVEEASRPWTDEDIEVPEDPVDPEDPEDPEDPDPEDPEDPDPEDPDPEDPDPEDPENPDPENPDPEDPEGQGIQKMSTMSVVEPETEKKTPAKKTTTKTSKKK